MGIPAGFPLYPDGKYHVSISFPGPPPLNVVSGISKSIEGKSPSLLLIPNVEYLQKFIEGNIGIGDSLLKKAFTQNFNSPVTQNSEFVFKKLGELTKIDVSQTEKYRVPPDTSGVASQVTGAATGAVAQVKKSKSKFKLPASEIKVNSEFDLGGIKGLEKSLLKSIFETQKPYIEIAKLVVANISKAEDIIARILPLALPIGTPLNTESEKPSANAGTATRPKALGFGGGVEIKKSLAKLEALSKKGGKTTIDENGKPIKELPIKPGVNNTNPLQTASQSAGQTNFSNNSEGINSAILPDGLTYSVVSAIYSTGNFDPNVDYEYNYIDLPPEEGVGDGDVDLTFDDDGDPYKGTKPGCIIFGIFDSKGKPFNPLDKLKGYDNDGTERTTNFAKADWITKSPKWKFSSGAFTWPTYGTPTFVWKGTGINIGQTRESKTKPDSVDTPLGGGDWENKRYEKGDKNRLNGEDAIPGDPIIASFDTPEVTEYQNFFDDLIEFKLANTSGITEADKAEARNAVRPNINIPSHLENVFLYGQSKSSVYKPISVPNLLPSENPYPSPMKLSLKPAKVYSAQAAADPNLRKAFGSRMDDRNGNVWVDPEADYCSKIIRVDPTTQIEYTEPGKSEPITATIQAFVKNALNIKIQEGKPFSIKVEKTENVGNLTSKPYTTYFTGDGLTNYYLENWNFNDPDGVLNNQITASTGSVNLGNNPPVQSQTNAYRITLWSDKNPTYFDKDTNVPNGYSAEYLDKITTNSQEVFRFEEVSKNGTEWFYNQFEFKITDTDHPALKSLRKRVIGQPSQIQVWRNKIITEPTFSYDEIVCPQNVDFPNLTETARREWEVNNKDKMLKVIKVDTTNKIVTFQSVTEVVKKFQYAKSAQFKSRTNNAYVTLNIDGTYTVESKKNNNYFETKVKFKEIKGYCIGSDCPSGDNPQLQLSADSSYFSFPTKIYYSIPVKELFNTKSDLNIPFNTDGTYTFKLKTSGCIIQIDNSKKITKWYYMTPKDFLPNNGGYGNGDLKSGAAANTSIQTIKQITTATGTYADTNKPLPANSYTRNMSIRNESFPPPVFAVDTKFNNFQIRVSTPNNPSGAIIDPSKVFNERLQTSDPFINIPGTLYGFGSDKKPQEIGVIKRFMLTEFDTESYYIIEGVLPEIADELLARGSDATATGAPGGSGYYKLPDAIGAIRVFISFLLDIFSKLIPSIKRLLKLLKDPLGFITDIVSEKLGEGFPFLSPEAFDAFKNGIPLAKQFAKNGAGGLVSQAQAAAGQAQAAAGQAQAAAGQAQAAAGQAQAKVEEKKSKVIKKLETHFKKSKLNGVVFVDQNVRFRSVLDGIGTIPFEMFGKDLSFGIELNMSKMPDAPPLKLVFPRNITLAKLKSDADNESNANATKNNNSNLINDNSSTPRKNVGNLSNLNQLPDGTKLNTNDYKIIDIKYSTGQFIQGVDYNYVYIDQEVSNLLAEADELIAKGTAEDLKKAEQALDAAKKIDPDNKLIDEKLKDVKKNQNFFESKTQPLIKFVLGIVTIPVKIVAKIIQWLIDFFKKLTSPLKLPGAIAELLSFKWILDFFMPPGPPIPGLLQLAGIKFDPTKLVEWTALSKIPNPNRIANLVKQATDAASSAVGVATGAASGSLNAATSAASSLSSQLKNSLPKPEASTKFPWPMPVPKGENLLPDDYELADLNQFISVGFNMKLPTYTARQIRTAPKNPLNIFLPVICLIEQIINGIIDFFWSLLGIEAIIPPPHIKLCKNLSNSNNTIEDIQSILNGESPKGATNPAPDPSNPGTQPADSVTPGSEAYIYEVTLPDGRVIQSLDYEELQKFIEENKGIDYDFQF